MTYPKRKIEYRGQTFSIKALFDEGAKQRLRELVIELHERALLGTGGGLRRQDRGPIGEGL